MDYDADMVWKAAEGARKLVLRACLRDKLVWGDQVVNVICGLIKVSSLAAALALILERVGFPGSFAQAFGALIVVPFLVFNPRNFFWRNIFSDQADAAYDEVIRQLSGR